MHGELHQANQRNRRKWLGFCNRELAGEELLTLLSGYAAEPTTPAMVMVTHHVEEIPVGFTHVLLLRDGAVIAAGPLRETLTEDALSTAFGVPIALHEEAGRYAARARTS